VERAAFRKKQSRLDVWRLIFVDEFGVHRAMSRIYARAPRGERARVKEPTAKGANSVISALRLSGLGATMMIEGAVDTQVWDCYIEHFLAPELEPGDIVILDQISFHGSPRAIGLIKVAGARVGYLPAYSPDLDPLEERISKIKGDLRSGRARMEPGLQRALKRAIEKVAPKDIRGWFKHCGYTRLVCNRSPKIILNRKTCVCGQAPAMVAALTFPLLASDFPDPPQVLVTRMALGL
jgi:hypothetical protein